MPMFGTVPVDDIWHFHPHPEVWLLVAAIAGAYAYAIRVIGPLAVRPGQAVVTRKQLACFIAGLSLLWFASDWPMHDIAEQRLYSVHMLQHMILSYFMPPLMLLAIPTWLGRLVLGDRRAWQVFSWLAKPVVAGVIFNAFVMTSHVPAVVNHSVESSSGLLHYSLHVVLVLTALLMWTPVCGPFPELRMGSGGKMIYLFAMSVIPTVPAGWLTFANGAVYKAYAHDPRLWGISVTTDQQLAGAIMKVGGSLFLWAIITYIFFARFMGRWEEQNTYRRSRRLPEAEIVGHDDETLTYDEVTKAFEAVPAAPEPQRPEQSSA
jgi:putative membrane protein